MYKELTKTARLELFKELFSTAEKYYAEELEKMQRRMKQYLGSAEIDGSAEPALTVRNITYEIVESEISSNE